MPISDEDSWLPPGKPPEPNRPEHPTIPSGLPPEEDFYFEDGGRWVFTEHYHLRRGSCCGSRCRHCPFNWENVPGYLKK